MSRAATSLQEEKDHVEYQIMTLNEKLAELEVCISILRQELLG